MRTVWLIIGFLMFLLGGCALALTMVGLDFSFLMWLKSFGALFEFVFKIVLMMGGIVVIALSRMDWERERRESSVNEQDL